MPPRPSLLLARVVLMALALVLAQALGLMHGAVHWGGAAGGEPADRAHEVQAHGHGHGHGHGHADEDADPDVDAHAHAEHANWAAHLFGGHLDGDLDCRLYDPHLHDGLPSVPALALPLALAGAYLATCQGEFLARWVALFDARGPPARS